MSKETNSPKDLWTDPKGNVVKVDPGKWNEHDLKDRLAAGWVKGAPVTAKPVKAEK